jgi:hypothetical protein
MGEEAYYKWLMSQQPGTFKQQLAAPAIGAGLAFAGSIPQLVEAQRLKKERDRLLKEGAPGLTPIEQEQLASARTRAASAYAPGYAQEMENIAQQQGDVLGAAKRAGIGGSNLLNTLTRLNQQGQAARRNLAMRGAQAQRAAQGDLQSLSMAADARRENRMRRWEDDMAAMDAARRQYNYAAAQSPLQGAMAFMPTGGFKFGNKAEKPTVEDVKFQPNDVMQDFSPDLVTGGTAPKLMPTADMTGLGPQLNMAEDIGYDPFKNPYGINPYSSLPSGFIKAKTSTKPAGIAAPVTPQSAPYDDGYSYWQQPSGPPYKMNMQPRLINPYNSLPPYWTQYKK